MDDDAMHVGEDVIRQHYEQQLQYLTLRNKSEISLLREKYEKQVVFIA